VIWRSSSSDTLSDKADKNTRTSTRREQNVPAFSSRRRRNTKERDESPSTFSLAISMTLSTLAIPMARQTSRRGNGQPEPSVWTNDDLEKLHSLGLISIVAE